MVCTRVCVRVYVCVVTMQSLLAERRREVAEREWYERRKHHNKFRKYTRSHRKHVVARILRERELKRGGRGGDASVDDSLSVYTGVSGEGSEDESEEEHIPEGFDYTVDNINYFRTLYDCNRFTDLWRDMVQTVDSAAVRLAKTAKLIAWRRWIAEVNAQRRLEGRPESHLPQENRGMHTVCRQLDLVVYIHCAVCVDALGLRGVRIRSGGGGECSARGWAQ